MSGVLTYPNTIAVNKWPKTPKQAGKQPEWGDFVDSDEDYEVTVVTESVELYEQGLFYPIRVGEILNDVYRVEHKLGHGGFSTVWMAHDMQTNTDVALKILIPGESGEDEYR